jgi:hypothetical protein
LNAYRQWYIPEIFKESQIERMFSH